MTGDSDRERRLARLRQVVVDKTEQGHDTAALHAQLQTISAQTAELDALARAACDLPLRSGWPYDEPDDLAGIRAAAAGISAPQWGGSHGLPPHSLTPDTDNQVSDRIRAGFLGSVCGCMLGKPVEFDPTLDELRSALSRIGEWPIDDYIPTAARDAGGLRMFHADWPHTVREQLRYAAPDDDINYTLIGMLALEEYGRDLSRADIAGVWLDNLPVGWTFGPERTFLARISALSLSNHELTDADIENLARWENPGEERCGAMIRADAYGYACPGDPTEATRLAWLDASMTHRRTGIYASMFVAALISVAFVVDDPLDLVEQALAVVPARSRFAHTTRDCLELVAAASSWLDAYNQIHRRYGTYRHCRVVQEIGTLVNTLRFADDVGHGICLQVMQGNDTDSFGATAGAVLGVRFGTAGLDQRWLEPLHDRIHTTVAGVRETSLSALADRVATLPAALDRSPTNRAEPPPASALGWLG